LNKVEEVFCDGGEARRRFSMHHYAVNYCPGNPKYSSMFAPTHGNIASTVDSTAGSATVTEASELSEVADGDAGNCEYADTTADDDYPVDAVGDSCDGKATKSPLTEAQDPTHGDADVEFCAEPADPLDVQFPVTQAHVEVPLAPADVPHTSSPPSHPRHDLSDPLTNTV
jgi:hypothetical protein